ncbi:hypothetical protein [Schaalia sp.]|uniref:hypothetical protein n=1 Tax=Schaalia sp. TaxID=2691890 RepID=UPI003D0F1568
MITRDLLIHALVPLGLGLDLQLDSTLIGGRSKERRGFGLGKGLFRCRAFGAVGLGALGFTGSLFSAALR